MNHQFGQQIDHPKGVFLKEHIYTRCRLIVEPTMRFSNRSDSNWLVQLQKMARDWKFWVLKVEELYCPCSENK